MGTEGRGCPQPLGHFERRQPTSLFGHRRGWIHDVVLSMLRLRPVLLVITDIPRRHRISPVSRLYYQLLFSLNFLLPRALLYSMWGVFPLHGPGRNKRGPSPSPVPKPTNQSADWCVAQPVTKPPACFDNRKLIISLHPSLSIYRAPASSATLPEGQE